MMTSSNLKLNNLLYLLAKDFCIIFVLFLCYTQQLLVAVLHSSCWYVARVRILLRGTPLIDQAPWNDVTSLTTYTMHTHTSDTNI